MGERIEAKTDRNNRLIQYHKDHPGMSYAAIGRVFHLTRERVRQIIIRHERRDGGNNGETAENNG